MSKMRSIVLVAVFAAWPAAALLPAQGPPVRPPSTGAAQQPPAPAQLPGAVTTQIQAPGQVPVPVPNPRTAGGEALEAESLPLIGHDLFDVDVAALKPGPVGASYILSPGDEVNLRVWGQLQLTQTLTVSPDQYLEIPEVPGRVYVAELSLSEVKDRLTRQLATAYAAYFNLDNLGASSAFVDVSLGTIRGVQFTVQGEVNRPGTYTLHPSLSNLIYALAQAGGVKDDASLRNIRIRRGGEAKEVDFYDFLLRGTLATGDLQIRNGDDIFVPLQTKAVRIQGEIRRPGTFDLHPDKNEDLVTLLELAGGVKASANTQRLSILRIQPNAAPSMLSIDLDAESAAKRSVLLMDQDLVEVPKTESLRLDFVSLQGNGVRAPGTYPLSGGLTINELIARAGGLRPEAYLERADLVRTGPDMRREYRDINLRLAAEGDPSHNIALTSLDELVVSSVIDVIGSDGEVTLRGHVKSPGVVPLSRGMRLYDLLFTRAGLQDRDFMRESYLERADLLRLVAGSTRQELLTFDLGKLLAGDSAQNFVLQSGDEVVVYSREEILGTERFVTLSGFVRKPGPQVLLQNMRLLDLLNGPGGFADPDRRRDAYLPRVDIWRTVRAGNTVTRELVRINLGEAFNGAASQNPVLESGDEVVVYAAADFAQDQTVEIDGAVNKPGTYELASNMTLGDLLIRGGGFGQLADRQTADLFRLNVSDGSSLSRMATEISLDDLTLPLHNGDRVLIRRLAGYQPTRVVAIAGEVQYPGRYNLTTTAARIADAVRMAGGLLDGAFLDGAGLYRLDDDDSGSRTRIVLDFERALKEPDSPDNLLLEDGDFIYFGRRSDTVTVVDEVEQPIIIAYAKGKGVSYYLQAAGGVTEAADPDAVAVIHPNGRYAPKRFLRGLEVLPGSTIVVPPRSGVSSQEKPVRRQPVGIPPVVMASQMPPPIEPVAAKEAESSQVVVRPQSVGVNVGFVDTLTGTCPALAFNLGTMRITTTEGTTFVGVTCADIKVGDGLEVTAVRQTDRVLAAVTIRRR